MMLFAIYLLVNLVGALLIFGFSHSIVQLAKQEERDYYDSVDGITFFCRAFPVFFFCCMINAGWGIKALIEAFKCRDHRALIALGIVLVIWAAAIFAIRLDS